jgi:hypothetical protein
MKNCLRIALSAAALVGLSVIPSSLSAATGDVTLSGSTWTGKVDGSTKYTGSSMAAAANACVAAMSSGTVNIRNSGNSNGQINLKSNVKIDGYGCRITGSGSQGIIYAQNSSNTGAKNLTMDGLPWFGMYFRTCQGIAFSGVNGRANLGFRIDNCKGGAGSNLALGSPNSTVANSQGGGSHYVETYGINGVTWGTVTAQNWGNCGVLLNKSTSASGTAVNANHCGNGTGYAAFRTANDNLGPTTVGTVNATNGCGRGFYSTTNSRNTTISTVNASNCTGIGIWLGSVSVNVRVNGGVVKNNAGGCWTDSNPAGSGNFVGVSCQ